MRPGYRLILISILIIGVLSGCSNPMTESDYYNTVLEIADAEREFPLFILDFSRSQDLKSLGEGWHLPEPGSIPHTRFLWSSAENSEINVDIASPQNYELILNIRPFVFEGSPEYTISLQWNDRQLGSIDLAKEWQVYRLVVPASAVVNGRNVLRIHQPDIFRPADVWENSTDERMIGSAYAYCVVRPEQAPLPPGQYTLSQVLGAKNTVFQGSQRHLLHDLTPSTFTYTIRLPSRPTLHLGVGMLPDRVEKDGNPVSFTVSIRLKNGDQSDELLHTVESPPTRALEMGWRQYVRDLSKYRNQTVELTFHTDHVSKKPGAPNNEASWLEPVIKNRHVPVNLFVFPGEGPSWPPKPQPEYPWIERLYYMSSQYPDVESIAASPVGLSDSSEQEEIPFPLELIREFRREGWQVGYFFTGRNQLLLEDLLADDFDALVGEPDTTAESCRSVATDAVDWLRRIAGSNFLIIIDYHGSGSRQELQLSQYESFIQKILSINFDLDSMILTYNSEDRAAPWLHIPEQKTEMRPPVVNGSWSVLNQAMRDVLKFHSE